MAPRRLPVKSCSSLQQHEMWKVTQSDITGCLRQRKHLGLCARFISLYTCGLGAGLVDSWTPEIWSPMASIHGVPPGFQAIDEWLHWLIPRMDSTSHQPPIHRGWQVLRGEWADLSNFQAGVHLLWMSFSGCPFVEEPHNRLTKRAFPSAPLSLNVLWVPNLSGERLMTCNHRRKSSLGPHVFQSMKWTPECFNTKTPVANANRPSKQRKRRPGVAAQFEMTQSTTPSPDAASRLPLANLWVSGCPWVKTFKGWRSCTKH